MDRHALLRHLEGKGLGEPVHARFSRRIIRLAERTFLAIYRGNVDDAAPSSRDHAIANLLGHVNTESRLVWMTASQSVFVIFLKVWSFVMPALLMSISTEPTSW